MEDAGLQTVRAIYQRMQVDKQWSVWEERGFVWWPHQQAQRIWADLPFEDEGDTLSCVHVQTDFLDRFHSADDQLLRLMKLSSVVTASGFVTPPQEPGKLRLAASMYVHEDVRAWMSEILSWIAPLQAKEASLFADYLRDQGEDVAVPDISSHPTSGMRENPDDMLNLATGIIRPRGKNASTWTGKYMSQLRETLQNPPCLLATGDESGITAEFPFPEYTSLMNISTHDSHPFWGNGCSLSLKFPDGAPDAKTMKRALELNNRETYEELTHTYFTGSWGVSNSGLTFVSFLPNAMYTPGALVNFGFSLMERAHHVTQNVYDYDWQSNFENDFERKRKSLSASGFNRAHGT